MTWITDWSEIEDNKSYWYAQVNQRLDGAIHLGGSLFRMKGWEVKRLRPGCYAAIELPEFDPAVLEWAKG